MRRVIIDFHTHIFPEYIAAKTMVAVWKRAGVISYTDGTIQGLKQSMQKAGVDISVISRITTRPNQVKRINRWLLNHTQPGICPLATLLPDLPDKYEIIKGLKAQGFKGIKLHPDYQDFYVEDRRMYPFYEAAQKEGLPILFHAGHDRGLPPPLHSTPEMLLRIHRDFPDLKMVAAHMGGEDIYEETEETLLGEDIYLDTSFVLREMPVETIRRFVRKHPIDRFIFGTDSPWKDQGKELEYLLSLSFLKDHEKERIAGDNAAELLDLFNT